MHQLHERCELMCLLTQLYCGPDPFTSASSHAVQVQLSQQEQHGGKHAELAAAVAEVKGIRWPECSEDRLQQLLELLGEAVFSSAGAAAAAAAAVVAAAGGGVVVAAGRQQWKGAESQLANMQQLAEALVSAGVAPAFACACMHLTVYEPELHTQT